jgi:hypothetical protein
MFSRGIVAAMEDETQSAAEMAIDVTGSESMEADLVDVVDMGADIDAGTSEMAQTVADADQLERHVEVLTEAEGEGGASPELVEATEIAVESIYARLGIYGATGIPALEAFSTKTGRARATRVAIEGIMDNVKKIWEAVKMAFQKLVNFVKDFFGKLFDTKKKVLARIAALEVKAKALKGTAKTGTVKGTGIGKVFGKDADKKITEFLSSKEVSEAGVKSAELLTLIEDFTKGVESEAAFNAVTASPEIGTDFAGAAPEGMKWVHIASFGTSDMISLSTKEKKAGKDAFKAYAASQIKIVKSAMTPEAADDLPTLTGEQMKKFLVEARSIVQATMNGKASEASIKTELSKAVAGIDRVIALAGKEDKSVGDRGTIARSAVTATGNTAIKGLALTNSETLRAVQAVLTYVERSAANYGEEKKPAEAKK